MTVIKDIDLLLPNSSHMKHGSTTASASFLEAMLGISYAADIPSKGISYSSEEQSSDSVAITGCAVKSVSGNLSTNRSSQAASPETHAPSAPVPSDRFSFLDQAMGSRSAKRKSGVLFGNDNTQADPSFAKASLSQRHGDSKSSKQEVFVRYTEKEKLQRRYECKLCKKRFVRPSSLTSHGYTHTGERPFACDHPGCTKRFSVLSNLRRHAIVHTRRRKSSTKEKNSRRSSQLQPYSAMDANAARSLGLSPDNSSDIQGFSSAFGSRTLFRTSDARTMLPYYPMSSSLFASGKHGARATQSTQGIQGICDADALDALDAVRLHPQQLPSICQSGSAQCFGSIAASSASFLSSLPAPAPMQPPSLAFSSSLQGVASDALFAYKLPTPVSNSSCNSSPESKWTTLPPHPTCLDGSRAFGGHGNICTTLAAPGSSTESLLSAPCVSLPLNSTIPGLNSGAAIGNQLTSYQQTPFCGSSVSSSLSDAGSNGTLGTTSWPIPAAASSNKSSNSSSGGGSGTSSLCSSLNDTTAIHAALSDILGPAQIASRPAVITGNSVTTKAMNSAIELLGEPRNSRAFASVSPLPFFPGCSEQDFAHKLLLQQGISSALNHSASTSLPPISSVQSCLGQIGGMVTAAVPAAGNADSSSSEGFSIDSWLDNMEKSAANGDVGTSNAAAAPREEPGMSDSVWQLLQACSNTNSYSYGSGGSDDAGGHHRSKGG